MFAPGRVRVRAALCGCAASMAFSAVTLADEIAPSPDDAAVATVDGRPITAAALRRAMVRRGADFLPGFSQADKKQELVESLVRTRILADQARDEGLDRDPDVAAQIESLLAQAYWRRTVAEMQVAPATAEDARAYYDGHVEEFRRPRRARGAVLVLRWKRDAGTAERDRVRSRSAALAKKAAGSRPSVFTRMIEEESTDPATRRTAGDTGFVVEGTTVFRFDPPVIEALFEIPEVGGVEVVETERGMVLVQLREREGGDVAAFELVTDSIRRRLSAERREQAVAEQYSALRQRAAVEIDSDVLRGVGPADLAASARPPAFPVGVPGP